jgi:hypothetical protein
MQEIKKLNAQIVGIRSEMSKNEDQLKDYQKYREFLEKLTPNEWLQERAQMKKNREAERLAQQSQKSDSDLKVISAENLTYTEKKTVRKDSTEEEEENSLYNDDSDIDEEAPLYFSNPQQLLDIFSELEENNLSLIQNCQEMEETLEELKQKTKDTEKSM